MTTADCEQWCLDAVRHQAAENGQPTLFTLPIAIFDGDQFLAAVLAHADQDERAQPVVLETDAEVNAIGPDIREALRSHVTFASASARFHPERLRLARCPPLFASDLSSRRARVPRQSHRAMPLAPRQRQSESALALCHSRAREAPRRLGQRFLTRSADGRPALVTLVVLASLNTCECPANLRDVPALRIS